MLKLRCLFSSYFGIRMEFSTTGLVDLSFFYLTTSFLSCGKTSIFQYHLQAVLHHRLFSLQRYGCPGRLQAPPIRSIKLVSAAFRNQRLGIPKKFDVSCLAFCLWWTSHLLCTKKGIVVKVTLECNFKKNLGFSQNKSPKKARFQEI